MGIDVNQPIFVISVAAELADMHPQTLRQYDRLGIVSPSRAPGKSRRYSQRDVDRLREVQRLSHEGVSLEGIKRIMQLENQVAALQGRVVELTEELARRRESKPTRTTRATLPEPVIRRKNSVRDVCTRSARVRKAILRPVIIRFSPVPATAAPMCAPHSPRTVPVAVAAT